MTPKQLALLEKRCLKELRCKPITLTKGLIYIPTETKGYMACMIYLDKDEFKYSQWKDRKVECVIDGSKKKIKKKYFIRYANSYQDIGHILDLYIDEYNR